MVLRLVFRPRPRPGPRKTHGTHLIYLGKPYPINFATNSIVLFTGYLVTKAIILW